MGGRRKVPSIRHQNCNNGSLQFPRVRPLVLQSGSVTKLGSRARFAATGSALLYIESGSNLDEGTGKAGNPITAHQMDSATSGLKVGRRPVLVERANLASTGDPLSMAPGSPRSILYGHIILVAQDRPRRRSVMELSLQRGFENRPPRAVSRQVAVPSAAPACKSPDLRLDRCHRSLNSRIDE